MYYPTILAVFINKLLTFEVIELIAIDVALLFPTFGEGSILIRLARGMVTLILARLVHDFLFLSFHNH